MIGFTLFAIVASFTPGPTNILVMASSAQRGLGATMPLVMGAALGVAGMVWAAGLGLAAPLVAYPAIHHVLTAIGMGWLGWLAWQLFRSAGEPVAADSTPEVAPGLLTGAGLQLVNPKAWMMALAVVGVFAPGDTGAGGASLRALVFLIVAMAGLATWGVLGRYGIGSLGQARHRRLFNRAMALLLVVAAGLSILV
ncbi:LysE family translocator [Salinisphaera sp. LB1]|uniref:LysE family translocator n=1 Tax=Salinisphaera sp. LB1 TaxID=2183911 RepID=UPI000D708DAB|nr:LysE family translocator [Salinisphaera sp. LB1]AWN16760.1 Transporter, LysE family [Salinisphaera sp. LB1]